MFNEISGDLSIEFKRDVFQSRILQSLAYSWRGEVHLRPSPSASFSPFDLEMPIQILRAIFVAIKYDVFGLMAQKYSILKRGTRVFSSSCNAE